MRQVVEFNVNDQIQLIIILIEKMVFELKAFFDGDTPDQ